MAIHSNHTNTSIFPGKGDYFFMALIAMVIYCSSIFKYGPGATFDSVNYLHAASTIDKGMLKTDGTPFYEWPPLFPAILSIAYFIGIDIIYFSTVLLGIVYVTNILITSYFLKKNIKNKYILALALIVLLFSIPILQVHIIIWSEPIFILLLLFNLLFAKEYFESGSIKSLFVLIVISFLLFLERKIEVYFIISNTVLILLMRKPGRVLHALIYSLVSIIPAIIWFSRRRHLSGKVFESANWQPKKIFYVLEQFINAFGSHFIPTSLPFILKIILLLTISIIIYLTFKKRSVNKSLKENKTLLLTSYYSFTYYVLLIVSLSYINISEEIDDRIMSPVYLLLIISIFIFLDTIIQNIRHRYSIVVLFTIVIWTTYPIFRTVYNINRWNSIGTGGYNRQAWNDNLIIKYLLKNQNDNIDIFTNNVNALSYHLNFKNNKKVKIYTEQSFYKTNSGRLVCLDKKWNFSGEDCLSEKWKNKSLLISNSDGNIWKISEEKK